jgi:DNA repair exonuclease SbcCD ATPase subunit
MGVVAAPNAASGSPRASPSLALSFNSLTNKGTTAAANPQQAAAAARARSTQETMQAIARIAEQQKMRAAATGAPPPPMPALGMGAASASSSHTLPSGFIHGGNQRVDAQAEVMRLTATIDTLNAKLASQSERLQRTEASLVRANRAMTSERATSNARLLRMQNEVKDLRAKESTIRENALAQARREVQKTDSAFTESVKRAEQYEAKMSGLEERVAALSGEKEALAVRISSLSTELEQSTARANAAEAMVSESTPESRALHEAELARMAKAVEDATASKAELSERLAEAETKHGELASELTMTKEKYDAAHAEMLKAGTTAMESATAHEELRSKLQAEVDALMDRNRDLQERLDEIVSFPIGDREEDTECHGDASDDDGAFKHGDVGSMCTADLESRLETVEKDLLDSMAEVDSRTGVEASRCYKRVGKLAKLQHALRTELGTRSGDTSETRSDTKPAHSHAEAEAEAEAVHALRAELNANQQELRAVGDVIALCPTGVIQSEDDAAHHREMIRRWKEVLDEADRGEPDVETEQDYDTDDATASQPLNNILFQTPPLNGQTQRVSTSNHAHHPVACRLGIAMSRAGHGRKFLPPTGINPMASYRLTRAKFDAAHASYPTAQQGAVPPEVAALIEAVSKDISAKCIWQRTAYLTAVGMDDQEIQKELSAYA